MKRRLLGLTTAGLAACGLGLQAQERPNILFIMSDDHTSQAISAYNGILAKYLPTPNLDRIANEGVRMDNCFVTNSISTPSRACILTGQYSQKNGVYALEETLDPNHPNVAKELQKAGYYTAIIGKWHLGSEPAGFDYYNIFPGQGRYNNPLMMRNGDWTRGKDGKPLMTEYGGHSTDVVANEAIRTIQEADKDKPFFVMCHFKAPHRNWVPADRFKHLLEDVVIPEPENLYDTYEGKGAYSEFLEMSMEDMTPFDLKGEKIPEGLSRNQVRSWVYQRYIKDYLRMIAGIDENVGRLLKYLDDNGLAENTIVVYTGDQGFFLGEHGWFDKRMMYEECLRMPLLIRYPKEIKAGSVNKDIVLNLDFAPMFLDYAGVKTPDWMQGESFRANMAGNTPTDWRQSMYYRYWMNDDYDHHVPAHYGIRTHKYKLVYFYYEQLGIRDTRPNDRTPEWEFYDLENDPAEMCNLYHDKKYKKIIAELKNELLRLKEKYDDKDDKYPVMIELNKKYW